MLHKKNNIHLIFCVWITSVFSCYPDNPTQPSELVGALPPKIMWLIKNLNDHSSDATIKNRLILYGPPGNGKTTIAHTIAQLSNSEFIEMHAPSIVSKYQGSGSKNIKDMFERAIIKARLSHKRVVVFIDEIDAIACDNESEFRSEHKAALEQLWLELDTYKKDPNIFIIVATNSFNKLHKTFLDRFGCNIIEIKNPDLAMRKEVLEHYFKQAQVTLSQELISQIAGKTDGLSIRCLEDLATDIKIESEVNNQGIISNQIIWDCIDQTRKKFTDNISEKSTDTLLQKITNVSSILGHSSLLVANIITIAKGLGYF